MQKGTSLFGDALFLARITCQPPRKIQPQNSVTQLLALILIHWLLDSSDSYPQKWDCLSLSSICLQISWEPRRQDISPGYGTCNFLETWKHTWGAYLDDLPIFSRICLAQKVRMDHDMISCFRQKLVLALYLQDTLHVFGNTYIFHVLYN